MNRLTDGNNIFSTIGKAIKNVGLLKDIVLKLAAYEDTGLEPEKIREILELFCWSQNFNGDFKLFITALKQLKEMVEKYEKLEKQGLLIKLPCKVGQSLYVYNYTMGGIREFIARDKTWIFENMMSFGKEVFLTREEAERALEVENE